MPEYDFHQLSPHDLEILTRDLLQAHWHVTLENFKTGKPVPVGTVVIKEKHPVANSKAAPVAVAAMIKREPGYDPEHGDWEYAYEQLVPVAEQKVTHGKMENCINCHRIKKESDYLFRPYLEKLK